MVGVVFHGGRNNRYHSIVLGQVSVCRVLLFDVDGDVVGGTVRSVAVDDGIYANYSKHIYLGTHQPIPLHDLCMEGGRT